MSYLKAIDVLPEELLDMIQKYVDGKYIYIPRKESNRKAWGESTGSKSEIAIRNLEIYQKYQDGVTIESLSLMYHLSPKSIQRIVARMKLEKE